jgi:hypothetical protein
LYQEAMMTFFHGTAAIFDTFCPCTRGQLTGASGAERATFFAASAADAAFYADKSAEWHAEQGLDSNRRIIAADIDLSAALVVGADLSADTVEIDGEEYSIDDDAGILRAAAFAGFTAVDFIYGNANNSARTVAVIDLSIVSVK